MPSPYSAAVPQLLQEIDHAFTNQFHIIQPFQSTDYLPGDRYGILDFQTYAPDPDRPELKKVRGGVEAKVIRASLLLSIAYGATGIDEQAVYRQGTAIFIQECLDLEHGLAQMHGEINDHQFIYELVLDGPIDKGISQVLRNRDTWLVNITADVALKLVVNRAIDGSHILPLSATQQI